MNTPDKSKECFQKFENFQKHHLFWKEYIEDRINVGKWGVALIIISFSH
jgi:hypothetical protein